MHRNGGHLKECLGTSRIDKFAKLKAQPAKKCLFFFVSFHRLLPKHRAADSFSLLCTNIESNQSFHCWKEPWDVMSAVQLCNLLWGRMDCRGAQQCLHRHRAELAFCKCF